MPTKVLVVLSIYVGYCNAISIQDYTLLGLVTSEDCSIFKHIDVLVMNVDYSTRAISGLVSIQ